MATGGRSKRWRLGARCSEPPKHGGVRLLDINALPPSDGDGDGEGSEGLLSNRMHAPGEDSFSISSSLQTQCSDLGCAGNGSDLGNEPGVETSRLKSVLEDTPHGFTTRSFEDAVFGSSNGGRSNGNSLTLRASTRKQPEVFLHALREYILEKQGVLGEGWHVEFKQAANGVCAQAIYCSPDGKSFESMSDVACYLGLMSNSFCADIEDSTNGIAFLQKGSLMRRRRRKELARLSRANTYSENQDSIRSSCGGEFSSDVEIIEPPSFDIKSDFRVTEAGLQDNGCSRSNHINIELPLQYENFFLLSLGEIDLRPLYHDKNHIWPVGYRSCWHDNITGSLFNCEVSDGGSHGPVFKVRRYPCSTSPIPNALTVLSEPSTDKGNAKDEVADAREEVECGSVIGMDYEKDNYIETLLYDFCPSQEDILSCLGSSLLETGPGPSMQSCVMPAVDNTPSQSNCFSGRTDKFVDNSLKDEIGEFLIEGNSTSSVWRMVCQTLVSACREVFKRSGRLYFVCNHDKESAHFDAAKKAEDDHASLAMFCNSNGPSGTPRVIHCHDELETSCEALEKWLEQDRFGLDVEFVEEIIEQLPGAQACSQYEFSNKINCFSESQMIGSQLLLAKRKRMEEETSGGLVRKYKKTRNLDLVKPEDHLPPGHPLGSRLPEELVGDVLQVWETLSRFYEILGLKEALSFEELEQELIDPWFDGPNSLEKLEKEIQEGRELSSQRTETAGGRISSTIESESAILKDDPPIFIQVETGSVNDAAQARVASRTYRRCTGIALTKAHSSLLKVLMGELQSKVAAFVDPNYDVGEPKSKRGRKKDVDNSVPNNKAKIDILPINELTWPELARRYILAFLAMDGNLDSSEIAIRESGKVFRCIQGDGGVLCGSLTGVASMEADALLLAEAEKQIADSLKREDEVVQNDYKDSEASGSYEIAIASGSNLPEWAQMLEPVKKLPTNVGTRIRKCIYDALERSPPEWARKTLEHSISKEVYKGNASGPTKKAVLSVLAEVCGESLLQKPSKGRKEKNVSSSSDIIMKQCRRILRRAAAADDGKVFCNLLGTTLVNPNDNEDEGLLGSPAMVSRPLDFRTIDLRLAVGAYGGSHEAFHEDVQEVWHNISTAYGDRSDLMQLAESLSKKFESLYQSEVLNLVQRYTENYDPECSNEAVKKELDDVSVSTDEMPKAPWEEGVCKVCGIDRDDDSVLLCDTCDSEYHTYCLSPPLARIPEGNWYCPSCVAGQCKTQDASKHSQVITRHRRKRYEGEDTRMLSEALNQLATSLGEKEYWELTLEERIFMLKFLCDEVLNSAMIREHLEQCADISADLQHKLRSLSVEWRNLKFREEMLTARSVMEMTSKFNGAGDVAGKEGMSNLFANYGRWLVQPQPLSNKAGYYATFSADLQQRMWNNIDGGPEDNGLNAFNKHLGQFYLKSMADKHFDGGKSQSREHYELSNMKLAEVEHHTADGSSLDSAPVMGNIFSSMAKLDQLNGQNRHPVSILPQPERGEFSGEVFGFKSRLPGAENSSQNNVNGSDSKIGLNGSVVPMVEIPPGSCLFLDVAKGHLEERGVPIPLRSTGNMSAGDNLFLSCQYNFPSNETESQHANMEASSIKKEISRLQDSISSVESQLLKVSLRRDFLGRDSSGRLYWVFGCPGKRPQLIADGSMSVQCKRRRINANISPTANSLGYSSFGNSILSRGYGYPQPCNSSCSSDLEPYNGICGSSQWVSYESDKEIQELVGWLRGLDARERDLKENILQWQRLQFQPSEASVHVDLQVEPSKSCSDDKAVPPQFLITNAAAVLEKRYGPCMELENNEVPKKRGKKSKGSHEERMYRCECLEPIWPSRYHCLSCHQTFCTSTELDGHDDGRCNPNFLGTDESKDNESTREGKGTKPEVAREKEMSDEADFTDGSRRGKSVFSSRLVKFQKKGEMCPYDFEEISCKFITNNSNKELVKEVGLLGSNGNVSFIESSPMYFDDPAFSLIHSRKDEAVLVSPVISATEEHISVSPLQGVGDSTITCNELANRGKSSINESSQQCTENSVDQTPLKKEGCTMDCMNDEEQVSLNDKTLEVELGQSCAIPEMSLRPLVGKVSQILRRLKVNLLDIDAALPKEALKPSKACLSKRCAWRSFVKSADSIYEMIQATITFENMIKTEYLKTGWWYWSSLTVAAKTSSASSLALRIYALDAAIMYQKAQSSVEPTDNSKTSRSGKRKKKDADG